MSIEVIQGDCLEILPTLEAGSALVVVADPPYFKVKMAEVWDRQWSSEGEYLGWTQQVLAECQRVLAPNGSLYWFAGPHMAARVECVVAEQFAVLNSIRWLKDAGWHKKAQREALRAMCSPWEAIVFAEQCGADATARGESTWAAKCDETRGFVFEPLRAYLDGERRRAGVDFEAVRGAVGCRPKSGLPRHWFTQSQWALPTAEHYAALQRLFNASCNGQGAQFLRREYEYLRREYEDLRRPFNVTADVPYTDVWEFPTVSHYPGKHPCEKPLAMIEHMLQVSGREGALVVDPFCGSGTTLVAAAQLGINGIGIEREAEYCTIARRRVAAETRQKRLAV